MRDLHLEETGEELPRGYQLAEKTEESVDMDEESKDTDDTDVDDPEVEPDTTLGDDEEVEEVEETDDED